MTDAAGSDPPRRLVGAVLCGGASRRMGADKALVEVEGVPMAARVAAALRAAGAHHVVLVGGDPSWSAILGLDQVPDRWPGQGPLGGLATALLAACEHDGGHDDAPDLVVLVAACDQPWLDGPSLQSLAAALDAAPEAVAALSAVPDDGRRNPFPAAWRAAEGPRLAALVDGGARRADAATDDVPTVAVLLAAAVVADVDRPEDLDPRS
ncbi:NTP transferase domain-containing protein [Aquihabitans sp. G128]|uniref:molybdenum cofactor guanylyltransferase n=1 Tax=Aquihabitans sp. G128 TaxID=2849779 RepID=UPI001C22B695|nr:NTP transferase domain-containing protein [Aquihabitans sp. G128]QXC62068.1 NTP transferase domain-containing protein [Aquihabitans sp. G128]